MCTYSFNLFCDSICLLSQSEGFDVSKQVKHRTLARCCFELWKEKKIFEKRIADGNTE